MMNETQNTIPLQTWHKTRLLLECVPFIILTLMLLFALFMLPSIVSPIPPPVYLVLGLAVLVLGFQAVQRLRDFLSGVAVVEEDVLERSWRSRGRSRQMFLGKFEKLGRIRMMPKAFFQSGNGVRYRVTYSPVSRIVWTVEPLP